MIYVITLQFLAQIGTNVAQNAGSST